MVINLQYMMMKKDEKMKAIKYLFNKGKNFYQDLDYKCGRGLCVKKDIFMGAAFMILMLLFAYIMNTIGGDNIYIKILYTYLSCVSLLTFLMMVSYYVYDKPGKNKSAFLKIIVFLSTGFFFVQSSPVLLLITVVNKIFLALGIEVIARNFSIVFCEISIYAYSYLFCVLYRGIQNFDMLIYILFIFFVYFIACMLRKITYKLMKFISYIEKYNFFNSAKTIAVYITSVFLLFASIAGLYISKYNDGEFVARVIFLIMPLVLFSGMEQLVNIYKQNMSDKHKLMKILYEELTALKLISYKKITNFSYIKIRIKLSISVCEIDHYKTYFEEDDKARKIFKKKKEQQQTLLSVTLTSCRDLLEKEYAVYDEKEKENFEQQLSNAIELLAQSLTVIR